MIKSKIIKVSHQNVYFPGKLVFKGFLKKNRLVSYRSKIVKRAINENNSYNELFSINSQIVSKLILNYSNSLFLPNFTVNQ